MDLQREAVHELRQFDPAVVEAADDFAEPFLRRHGDPVFAAALHAELLHDTLQIEHLLRVACDELTDLVHDEHQRVARLTALHEFDDAVGQAAGRYVDLGRGSSTHESAIG